MKQHSDFNRRSSGKRIVLTGGPGVGKTTIIRALQELKYEVREEVFTKLFDEAQRQGRFNDRFLHSPELIHDLLSAQKKLEAQPTVTQFLFLDRSRIDIWGFSKSMGITPFVEDQGELEAGEYDLIFLLEPLPAKYYDQNLIRRQNYEESLEHHLSVTENYLMYLNEKGLDPKTCLIKVPFYDLNPLVSTLERTHFILNEVASRLPHERKTE